MTALSETHDYGPTIGTGPTARPTNPHPDSPAGRAAARLDRTHAGLQTVLPGAERASDATMAQRQANAPLKPKRAQQPCDDGLFSDQRNQQEMF